MKYIHTSLICLGLATSLVGCNDKKSPAPAAVDDGVVDPDNGGTYENPDAIKVAGKLAIQALNLAGVTVTNAIALNVETGDTDYYEVEADGTFDLNITRGSPWIISFIDKSKTGAAMLVSTLASGTLDTLNGAESAKDIDLGSVDASSPKATSSLNSAGILSALGVSAEAAATIGALDDSSLRYTNPDIDNNSVPDAIEFKSYPLDFHNRFSAKTAGGAALSTTTLKNAFYANTTKFSYTGTGIFAQIPRSDLDGVDPTLYQWKFSVNMPTAGNGGAVCAGNNTGTITAGTYCDLTYNASNTGGNDFSYALGLETANLKGGDYTLKVGAKTYQWTGVAISDFSAGEGFLALFIRIDVNAQDKITGLSYKWQKKGADNVYSLATAEEVGLIVKKDEGTDFAGYVSLKYQNNQELGGLGFSIPAKASEGSIVIADEIDKTEDSAVQVGGTMLTKEMVKAGVNFADFTSNMGISYDDKLGMRFFF